MPENHCGSQTNSYLSCYEPKLLFDVVKKVVSGAKIHTSKKNRFWLKRAH
jgi:hypothetical protein